MFRKLFSILTMSSILLISSGLVFGQSKNDWSAVEDLKDQEIAVKTKSGMKYGIIKSVDSDGLVLQLAGKKRMTQDEIKISKNKVKKLWRAFLFANNRNTGKGALIGAGVGAVAFGVPSVTGDGQKDGLEVLAFPVGAAIGGLAGGAIGYLVNKKHKKKELIYKK